MLLYVIADCVRSNKRYSNPFATAFCLFMYLYFILQGKVCDCDVSVVLGMR